MSRTAIDERPIDERPIDEPTRRARDSGDEAEQNRAKLKRELKEEIELPVKGSA